MKHTCTSFFLLFFPSDLEFEHKDPDPGNFVTSEDEGVRLKWTAFLEFTQNQDVGDMTWDKVLPIYYLLKHVQCIGQCLISADCTKIIRIIKIVNVNEFACGIFQVSPSFPHSDKLRELVYLGIPHSMRAPVGIDLMSIHWLSSQNFS